AEAVHRASAGHGRAHDRSRISGTAAEGRGAGCCLGPPCRNYPRTLRRLYEGPGDRPGPLGTPHPGRPAGAKTQAGGCPRVAGPRWGDNTAEVAYQEGKLLPALAKDMGRSRGQSPGPRGQTSSPDVVPAVRRLALAYPRCAAAGTATPSAPG